LGINSNNFLNFRQVDFPELLPFPESVIENLLVAESGGQPLSLTRQSPT
jgi:hypothetical protein